MFQRKLPRATLRRSKQRIPSPLKRALASRDGGCRFPGCTHTRFTEGHHVRHWADGGATKLGNHRLVHEGGFGLRATDDGVFVFTRQDGTRVAGVGRLRPQLALTLLELNRDRGIAIDAQTATSGWQGETMDHGLAAEAIHHADHEHLPTHLGGPSSA